MLLANANHFLVVRLKLCDFFSSKLLVRVQSTTFIRLCVFGCRTLRRLSLRFSTTHVYFKCELIPSKFQSGPLNDSLLSMALRYAIFQHPVSDVGVRMTTFGTDGAAQARIVALRDIQAKSHIITCTAHISVDEIPSRDLVRSFSAIERSSSRKQTSHWLLGPARFANHSCVPNAVVSPILHHASLGLV
jgi:hypothetical protein